MKQLGIRSSVSPLVNLSHHSNVAAACGRFAAERCTGKRYRSTAATAPQPRATAGNAGNVMLTAELTRLNTDLR